MQEELYIIFLLMRGKVRFAPFVLRSVLYWGIFPSPLLKYTKIEKSRHFAQSATAQVGEKGAKNKEKKEAIYIL